MVAGFSTHPSGRFGLSSVKSVLSCAFLASWVQALVCLPIRFPNLKSFIDSFLASPSEFPMGIVLSSLIPAASKLSYYLPENNKLQKKLSSELAESSLNNVLKASVLMRDAARFRCLTGKGAGAWISAVPSSASFAIDSCVYRLVCKLRLGLPVCSSEWLRSCECGAALDDTLLDIIFCPVNSAEGPFGAMNLLQRFGRIVSGSFNYHAEGNLGIGIPTLKIGLILCRWVHHQAWELIWISRWHTHGVARSYHHLLN